MHRKCFPALKLTAAAFFAAATLSACVSSPRRGVVYVRTRPPTEIAEVRGPAPGPGHVWVRGYHAWRGGDYVWVPGHWDHVPRPRAVWVDGRWKQDRDGWYWVDGHWK